MRDWERNNDDLIQGNMSVDEYTAKFIEKYRSAHLFAKTPMRIDKYFSGLTEEILTTLVKKYYNSLYNVNGFWEAVEIALRVQDECKS